MVMSMTIDEFEADLLELESAEDFLHYFEIDFDATLVNVNRLHILQRFHDYLADTDEMPAGAAERRALYAELLRRSYEDFVRSDAKTEKVFRVFQQQGQTATFDLEDLKAELRHAP